MLKCSYKMVNTLPYNILKVFNLLYFNLRSVKTILWTFIMFSGTTAEFGRPERSASAVFVRLHFKKQQTTSPPFVSMDKVNIFVRINRIYVLLTVINPTRISKSLS